jgi:hypothetical protein
MNMKQTLRCLLTFPIEESILICGNHGIGKSQIVRQATAMLGIPNIDFRLSQNDVGDLKGMPFHVNGRTVFAPPEFFPLKEADAVELKEFLGLTNDISKGRFGDKGILFLDEINRANREVQQAAFELVLDRRLNLRSLPDGWRVVSAINSEDDIYSVNSLDPAFLSRFFKIDLEPTIEEWLSWAESSGVHPVISGFIRKNPTLLDPTKEQLIEASTKGVVKLHDRRAYHKFSNTINKMVADFEAGLEDKDPLTKDPAQINWLFMVASGYIGTIASAQFKNYLETDYQALDANIILNKWSSDVEARLSKVVEIGRIPELAAYNEGLLAYISKNIKEKLTPTQAKNLARYITLLPNELRGDFWQKFHKDNRSIAEAWYRENSLDGKPNKTLVLSALVNPDAAKKNAALAGTK